MQEPLILLPGMMCDARLFAPQIAALSGAGCVHLAPTGGADRVEMLAENVLAHAPPHFALCGHGLGGIIAMEIVRRAPQRVSRIALFDTNAQAETPSVAASREEQIVRARSGKLNEVLRDELRVEDLAPSAHRAEIFAMFGRMSEMLGPEVYVNQARAMQRRPDQQKTLRKLKIPTLIACGELDRQTPVRRHEFLAKLVDGARFEIVAGAGHLPSLEQPETVTGLLQSWLEEPMVLRQPVLRSA